MALPSFFATNRTLLGVKNKKNIFTAQLGMETMSQNRTGKENYKAKAPTVSQPTSFVRIHKSEQCFLLLVFN